MDHSDFIPRLVGLIRKAGSLDVEEEAVIGVFANVDDVVNNAKTCPTLISYGVFGGGERRVEKEVAIETKAGWLSALLFVENEGMHVNTRVSRAVTTRQGLYHLKATLILQLTTLPASEKPPSLNSGAWGLVVRFCAAVVRWRFELTRELVYLYIEFREVWSAET